MTESYSFKPDKNPFVYYRFLIKTSYLFIFFLILTIIASIILPEFIFVPIIAFFVISFINYYLLSIRYKKEIYIFQKDKFIHKSGGLFSEDETELVIRNITHVSNVVPFIENKLFGTGNILIESAGSGKAEVILKSVKKSEKIFTDVKTLMKSNGFKLTENTLIQEESPSTIGVFFEVFKNFLASIFAIFYLSFYVGFGLIETYMSSLILLFLIIISVLLIRTIIQFLDFKLRVYKIYSDTITYSEGFLTKNYAFMPVENLSDTLVTQTLVDKIFSLNDLQISCQGAGQEILFKNLTNGSDMKTNIDRLVNESKTLVGTAPIVDSKETNEKIETTPNSPNLTLDGLYTGEFVMSMSRSLFPLWFVLLIIPLIPMAILMLIITAITVSSTKFYVRKNSMEYNYNFITKKNIEFSNDKIMTVLVKENFVDKWFNTCSINFWSIGSSENIIFKNIKKTDKMLNDILSKIGIREGEKIYENKSNFSIISMLKANLLITIFITILLMGLLIGGINYESFLWVPFISLIVALTLFIVYKTVYYSKSELIFYDDFVYFKRGIFFKEFYFTPYNNIKDITTIKYPMSKLGSIIFNVAGEHILQQNKKGNAIPLSNSFKFNYANNIELKDEILDKIFLNRPNKSQILEMESNIQNYTEKPLFNSKPDLANSLFALIIGSIIFFPFIALLPVTIPLVIWNIKVKSYHLESYRIVAKWGMIYKHQTSIIYTKIDHINFDQKVLNKMFKNGNISINTAGSSKSELVIKDISNYKSFYEELKKHY